MSASKGERSYVIVKFLIFEFSYMEIKIKWIYFNISDSVRDRDTNGLVVGPFSKPTLPPCGTKRDYNFKKRMYSSA